MVLPELPKTHINTVNCYWTGRSQRSQRKTVAVLTRNGEELHQIESVLKTHDIECYSATTMGALINMIEWRNIVVVIIGDIGEESIPEFCQDLEEFFGVWRKPRILVVTNSIELDVLTELAIAGADSCIERPLLSNELTCKVRALLDGVYSDLASDDKKWVSGRLGHFDVHSELGRGGTGVVYEAFDRNRDAWTALKILPPYADLLSMLFFQREAEILKKLKHQNIIQIQENGRIDDLYFMTLELIDRPLDQEVFTDGPEDEDFVRHMLTELAKALEYVHDCDVFHLDLKPSNILLKDRWTPILADFGLSRYRCDQRFTNKNDIYGTVGYLSPEAAAGEECDERADLFALGVLALELLFGKNPGGSHSITAQMQCFENAEYKWKTEYKKISPQLESILSGLLEYDSSRRTRTATQLLRQLGRCA
jgi:hypothetical protein